MSIITLTTDFGLKDHFVGALKGKLLSDFSEAKIIDISHDVDPFNTIEASYIIAAAYKSFPKGTVHIIGVDAELNFENRHIAMQWNDHYFICADNGILSLLVQKFPPQKLVELNVHDRFPSEVTDMDIFIKVGCHLAKGGSIDAVGNEITNLKEVTELQPVLSADKQTLKGNVIYIDHFGNVVTNITKELFTETCNGRPFEIPIIQRQGHKKSSPIRAVYRKYSEITGTGAYGIKIYEGDKLAIFNEAGFLEIAIFRSNPMNVGSASSLLGLGYRDTITIKFLS